MSEYARGGFISGDDNRPVLVSNGCEYLIPKSVARRALGDWLDRLNEKRDADER